MTEMLGPIDCDAFAGSFAEALASVARSDVQGTYYEYRRRIEFFLVVFPGLEGFSIERGEEGGWSVTNIDREKEPLHASTIGLARKLIADGVRSWLVGEFDAWYHQKWEADERPLIQQIENLTGAQPSG